MIYRDIFAHLDKPGEPDPRGINEKCLNCGFGWATHTGWACNSTTPTYFDGLKPTERYITNSMAASIGVRVWTRPDGSNVSIQYVLPPPPLPLNLTRDQARTAFPISDTWGLMVGDKVTIDHDGIAVTYTIVADPYKDGTSWPVSLNRPDTDDWRAWAHNVPGECKCGIPIERCDYHRPSTLGR